MQGIIVARSGVALVAAAMFASCSGAANTAAGQTPVPSNTTLAQANSTSAPMQAMSKSPGAKYVAVASSAKDITFEVWVNGTPAGTVQWPNKALDITKAMRGHANVLVIKWTKTKKDGMGTMSIQTTAGAKQLTVAVRANSPNQGGISKTIIAPQMPSGRSSTIH